MEPKKPVPYFVFLNFDPEYERLRRDRSTQQELEAYITKKHDKLLSGALKLNTYRKRFSMAIVDGFAVEMTDKQVVIQDTPSHLSALTFAVSDEPRMGPLQAELLRSAGEVRVVEKNLELD